MFRFFFIFIFLTFSINPAFATGNVQQPQPFATSESLVAKANKGDKHSQYDLGLRYEQGRHVPKDDKEAVKWFRLSAEQGHSGAQHALAEHFEQGRGIPQNYMEAAKWYRQAANFEQNVTSREKLAHFYYQGLGVPQDYMEAHFWFRLSEKTGYYRLFAAERDAVTKHLTPEQITIVKKRVDDWKQKEILSHKILIFTDKAKRAFFSPIFSYSPSLLLIFFALFGHALSSRTFLSNKRDFRLYVLSPILIGVIFGVVTMYFSVVAGLFLFFGVVVLHFVIQGCAALLAVSNLLLFSSLFPAMAARRTKALQIIAVILGLLAASPLLIIFFVFWLTSL